MGLHFSDTDICISHFTQGCTGTPCILAVTGAARLALNRRIASSLNSKSICPVLTVFAFAHLVTSNI